MTKLDWPASDQALWYVAVRIAYVAEYFDRITIDDELFFNLWSLSIWEGR